MINTLFLVRREIKINLTLHDPKSGFIFGTLSIFLSDKVITLFLVRREIKINLPLHDANSGFIFGPLSIVLSVDLFSEHHMILTELVKTFHSNPLNNWMSHETK